MSSKNCEAKTEAKTRSSSSRRVTKKRVKTNGGADKLFASVFRKKGLKAFGMGERGEKCHKQKVRKEKGKTNDADSYATKERKDSGKNGIECDGKSASQWNENLPELDELEEEVDRRWKFTLKELRILRDTLVIG